MFFGVEKQTELLITLPPSRTKPFSPFRIKFAFHVGALAPQKGRIATYAKSPLAFGNWYRGRICRTDAALWHARALCREQEADHRPVVALLEPTRM